MDRLSGLPDSLIHHILSFLPMEYVVRTTILSKRWKDLWTTVPCLEFIARPSALGKFRDFVNGTLILWRGAKIDKFSIVSYLYDPSLSRDQKAWVHFALQHKVDELELSCLSFSFINQATGCLLPHSLFSSSSIKKLRLYCFDIVFHEIIRWDQLKSLEIQTKNVDQIFIDNVLLGSPQLEILELCCARNLNIRSTSLKKLCIHYGVRAYSPSDDDEIGFPLHILTPNLEVLEISGFVYRRKCLFLGVPTLIEATLNLYDPTYYFDESDNESRENLLRVIFLCINHVEKLKVGYWCFKVLAAMKKSALPLPLLNLKSLRVDTHFGKDFLSEFVNLLEISPNVAMVAIEISDFPDDEEPDDYLWHPKESLSPEVELSDSILINLRIFEIESFFYHASLLSLAKFVLERASALEKIVITIEIIDSGDQDVLLWETGKLLRMPRLSPNAEVVLQTPSVRRVLSGLDSS